jgi:hypothetical protein
MTYSPSFFNKESKGSSRQTVTNFMNGYGSDLVKGRLVSVNTSGYLVPTTVYDEVLVQAIVGMTNISIPNAATGSVVDNGRLEDISTSFSVGDAIYLNRDGNLTNIKPEIGVSGFVEGDFVIFLGVVIKNEFNASLKDIKLMISVIGQL